MADHGHKGMRSLPLGKFQDIRKSVLEFEKKKKGRRDKRAEVQKRRDEMSFMERIKKMFSASK